MTTRIYKPFWPGQPLLNEPYLSAFTYSFPPAPKDKYSPTTPAFIDAATGKTILRGDVRRIALQLGHGFAHGLRKLVRPGWDGVLRRGDVVLLFSPNTIAFPLTIYGAVAAGLTVSTANSAYTPPELLHQLRDSHAKAIIVHPTLVPIALQTLALAGFSERDARARIIICDYQGLGGQVSGSKDGRREFVWVEDLMGTGTLAQEERFDGEDADATMFLCYSSGTTGKPKGVMTTHKNVVAVSRAIECAGEVFGPGDLHIQAGVLPFFHIFALSNTLFHGPSIGCPIVVMERFDPVLYPKYIEQYKISVSLIVPPIVIALLRHPAADKFDLRSLKTVISGAAPLGAPLAREFYEKMLKRGADVAVLQGYGLTETSPSVTLLPREWSTRKYGKAGALLASLEVRLVDDDGKDAPKGGPGELWVRGPVVMKGYLGNEAATRDSITPDKWFKTGDVAVVDDDGFYAIVDRKKELIKYKGFQVPPAELESALLEHPEVADAAVTGIEDKAEATELPRAYVVHVKPSTIPTPEDKAAFAEKIQAWMRQRVARHKHLRGGCIVIDAIPKSAAGKILRKDLRALAAKEVTSAQAGSPGKAKL